MGRHFPQVRLPLCWNWQNELLTVLSDLSVPSHGRMLFKLRVQPWAYYLGLMSILYWKILHSPLLALGYILPWLNSWFLRRCVPLGPSAAPVIWYSTFTADPKMKISLPFKPDPLLVSIETTLNRTGIFPDILLNYLWRDPGPGRFITSKHGIVKSPSARANYAYRGDIYQNCLSSTALLRQ